MLEEPTTTTHCTHFSQGQNVQIREPYNNTHTTPTTGELCTDSKADLHCITHHFAAVPATAVAVLLLLLLPCASPGPAQTDRRLADGLT